MREPAPAPKGLEQVHEALPAGLTPAGFARAFCQVFRAEIEARRKDKSCPDSSRSDSRG